MPGVCFRDFNGSFLLRHLSPLFGLASARRPTTWPPKIIKEFNPPIPCSRSWRLHPEPLQQMRHLPHSLHSTHQFFRTHVATTPPPFPARADWPSPDKIHGRHRASGLTPFRLDSAILAPPNGVAPTALRSNFVGRIECGLLRLRHLASLPWSGGTIPRAGINYRNLASYSPDSTNPRRPTPPRPRTTRAGEG